MKSTARWSAADNRFSGKHRGINGDAFFPDHELPWRGARAERKARCATRLTSKGSARPPRGGPDSSPGTWESPARTRIELVRKLVEQAFSDLAAFN